MKDKWCPFAIPSNGGGNRYSYYTINNEGQKNTTVSFFEECICLEERCGVWVFKNIEKDYYTGEYKIPKGHCGLIRK